MTDRTYHDAWAPEHPVRVRPTQHSGVGRFLTVEVAVSRIHGYEARGAVPQPGDVRQRLAAGEVITTHVSEYELLAEAPRDDW
jgi:hypothetical protein